MQQQCTWIIGPLIWYSEKSFPAGAALQYGFLLPPRLPNWMFGAHRVLLFLLMWPVQTAGIDPSVIWPPTHLSTPKTMPSLSSAGSNVLHLSPCVASFTLHLKMSFLMLFPHMSRRHAVLVSVWRVKGCTLFLWITKSQDGVLRRSATCVWTHASRICQFCDDIWVSWHHFGTKILKTWEEVTCFCLQRRYQ